MNYRELGKTGKSVSILGFGCMRLPLLGGSKTPLDTLNPEKKIDEEEGEKMVQYAFENGINYFDTAYRYHTGQSEPFLGRVLRPIRNRIMLATKLPVWMVQSGEDFDRLLDEQLDRLDTDYLDFYLLHGLSRKSWENVRNLGVLDFLDRALSDGRIRHMGFSFHDGVDAFREIVDSAPWDVCLIQFNYVDVNYQAGIEGLNYASQKGLGVIVMEPLKGGKLAGQVPEAVIKELGKSHIPRSPAHWALLWVWDHPQVSLVLSGMSSLDQLKENMGFAREAEPGILKEEDRELIRRVREIYSLRMRVDCTNCGYCMPCPNGVNIPANLSLFNDMYMFEEKEVSIQAYNRVIPQGQRASACVGCGLCETLCPQQIPIVKELKNVDRELGEN